MQEIVVTLTESEMAAATAIGVRRDHSHQGGGPVILNRQRAHIEGARAELAVVKGMSVNWTGRYLDARKWAEWRHTGSDVDGYEVRSTYHPSGRLICHPNDKDDAIFILVRAKPPRFVLAGWSYGWRVKTPEYWIDVGHGRPAYYLPNSLLKPMGLLRKGTGQG